MKKIILLLALLLIACGPSAKFVAPDYRKPQSIALLPVKNQTTDVKGALVFRSLLYEKLRKKKYAKLLEIAVVDSVLNELGITDGGQLTTISKEELFKALSVDGLLFIDLLACDYQTLGVSETKKVEANCKLYVLPSKLGWEDKRKISEGKSAAQTLFLALLSPAAIIATSAVDFGRQLIEKGSKMWLLDHELKPEMKKQIEKTLQTFP